MSNFRIVILALLVVALVVLGLIYVNISGRMDVIQQQQQLAASAASPVASAPSPYLPMPTQAPQAAMQPAIVADPVVAEELAHATAELERIKKENEELKRHRAVAEEERALIERRSLEKGDPQLQWLNDITDAELVGRVTEYFREANLVLFQAIGQPELKVGQELGIRRRGGIFAALVVDGIDADGKTYQSYVKRNKLFDGNDKEPLKTGDEVIIPPASWHDNMPDMEETSPESGVNPPVAAPASDAPQPFVVPMEP